jgi:sulfur-carrier protein
MIRFRFVRPFRDAVGKSEIALEAKGTNLVDVLRELVCAYPALDEHLYERGALSPYVNIYVNAQPIDVAKAPTTNVKDGDEILFLLPLTGG